MRIAVIGAGAVGSYFGGKLAHAGSDVVFLARGKNLKALRHRPLQVESIKGDFEVNVRASDSSEEAGAADVILLAVKAWQVLDTGPMIRPLLQDGSVVVPLQNGVEAPAQLTSMIGSKHVVGGLCKIIAYMTAPAHVRHIGAEPFVAFGELQPAGHRDRLDQLRQEFLRAGVTCEIPADIEAAMWEKFVFIASISGVGAVTRLPIGAVRSAAAARAQLEQAIREIVAVARARRVALDNEIVEQTMRYIDSLPAEGTSSMQRDIAEGRPSELEAQNGAVVRLARIAGVATPTHDAIYAALLPLESRARARV